jgi:plasmid maintenance system antidote protein VapI
MANDVTPSAADLRALLARHEIRRYEIAPAVGLNPAKLGRLLNGREPLTPQLAQRIADAIDRELDPGPVSSRRAV